MGQATTAPPLVARVEAVSCITGQRWGPCTGQQAQAQTFRCTRGWGRGTVQKQGARTHAITGEGGRQISCLCHDSVVQPWPQPLQGGLHGSGTVCVPSTATDRRASALARTTVAVKSLSQCGRNSSVGASGAAGTACSAVSTCAGQQQCCVGVVLLGQCCALTCGSKQCSHLCTETNGKQRGYLVTPAEALLQGR